MDLHSLLGFSDDPQISMMRSFFAVPKSELAATENEDSIEDLNPDRIGDEGDADTDWGQFAEAVRYSSDEDDENLDDGPLSLDDSENGETSNPSSSSGVAPPRKGRNSMSHTKFNANGNQM